MKIIAPPIVITVVMDDIMIATETEEMSTVIDNKILPYVINSCYVYITLPFLLSELNVISVSAVWYVKIHNNYLNTATYT